MGSRNGKWFTVWAVIILSVAFLWGCSNDDVNNSVSGEQKKSDSSNNETENNEAKNLEEPKDSWTYDGDPVTLKFRIGVDEETFQVRYKDIVEEKFDNIELELVRSGYGEDAMQELFAQGIMPDLHMGRAVDYLVNEYDYMEPIDPYVEEYGFDLTGFQDGLIEGLRAGDPRGEDLIYGLPIEGSVLSLFYNKDVFDLLGEPYPEDKMTWDETLDLARRLTREHNGIQYRGLQFIPNDPFTQLSIQGTDSETGEILFLDNPNTKKYFDLLDKFRSIPNILGSELEGATDGFEEGDRNIAMVIRNSPWLELLTRIEDFNFDMATVPTFDGLPNVAPTWGALTLSIPKQSKNKEAAWAVVSFLASEEGQVHLSQAGSPPVLANQTVLEEFTMNSLEGSDRTFNSIAPFKEKLAPLPRYSKYDDQFSSYILSKGSEFLRSEQDTVTFLREMGEEYAEIVEEIKGSE